MELDTVTVADYRDLLASCELHSVDAIISDMPYNATNLAFDQIAIDLQAFWSEARRVLKDKQSPVILFSQQPFTTDLIMSNRKGFRYEIIYEKTMPTGFLDAKRRPLRSHENIIIFGDGLPEYAPQMEETTALRAAARRRTSTAHYNKNKPVDYIDDGTRYPRSVWKFAQRDTAFENTETLHPTQKPLALMERLILTYTCTGDVVLDPFAGSGTTLIAARNTGRHFIGGDTSAEYVDIARKRLAQPYTVSMF